MSYLKFALVFLVLPLVALAAPAAGFLDTLPCVTGKANCQLKDIADGFNALIKLLLGGMGAVALLYFVIGGFQWLTSRGNQEKVRKGQQTMINTVIALFIAFTSYLTLSFFVNDILGVKNDYAIGDGLGQCQYKENGTPCNVVAGSSDINPFQCYQQKCITKCELKANMTNQNWQCYNFTGGASLNPDSNQYWEKNICDGGVDKVCFLLKANGEPALFDDPAYIDVMRLMEAMR